jgi:hypothetical protein
MGSSIAAAAVVAVLLITFLCLLSSVESDSCPPNAEDSSACVFETKLDNKMYRFDLAAQIDRFPHGVRSEDGFYKVIIKASSSSEHMNEATVLLLHHNRNEIVIATMHF